MALIKCKECGNEVSDKAENCPECGAKVGPKQYGSGTLIVAIVGIIALVAWIGGWDSTPRSSVTEDPPARAAPRLSDSYVAAPGETEMQRSMPGDKGRYFLLSMVRTNDVVRSLHKRVGVDSVVFSLVESNCATRRYRDIGYSEVGPDTIAERPSKWTELFEGSSKSDLWHFVCAR